MGPAALAEALAGHLAADGRPESGAAAAATVHLAARLVEAAAEPVARERAQALARRAAALLAGNLATHDAARAVLDAGGDRAAIEDAAGTPLAIAATGADVAALAAELAPLVPARAAADVAGAAALAAGATRAAAGLVLSNLIAGTDELVAQEARELADAAAASARAAGAV